MGSLLLSRNSSTSRKVTLADFVPSSLEVVLAMDILCPVAQWAWLRRDPGPRSGQEHTRDTQSLSGQAVIGMACYVVSCLFQACDPLIH